MSGCEPGVVDGLLARCCRSGAGPPPSLVHRASLRGDRSNRFTQEDSFMLKRRGRMWLVLLWLGAMAWLPTTVQAEPARWNLDPEHSTIEFRVAHMVVSKTTGRFMDYTGFIDMDAEDGTVTAIEATIMAEWG